MTWQYSFQVDRCPKTLDVRLRLTAPDTPSDEIGRQLTAALTDRPDIRVILLNTFTGPEIELARIVSTLVLKETVQRIVVQDGDTLQKVRRMVKGMLEHEVKATGVSTITILGHEVEILSIVDFSKYLAKLAIFSSEGSKKPNAEKTSKCPSKQVSVAKPSKKPSLTPETLKSYAHRIKVECRRRNEETSAALENIKKPSDLKTKCYICHVKKRISNPSQIASTSDRKDTPDLAQALAHYHGILCENCAIFNWEKRSSRAILSGKIALVTGGRIKIGFEIVLVLLRAGCRVIATTRFKDDAIKRFRGKEDYETWKDRLHVYEVDFRDFKGIYSFTAWVKSTFPSLNILINNAAQTIDRPEQFYHNERSASQYRRNVDTPLTVEDITSQPSTSKDADIATAEGQSASEINTGDLATSSKTTTSTEKSTSKDADTTTTEGQPASKKITIGNLATSSQDTDTTTSTGNQPTKQLNTTLVLSPSIMTCNPFKSYFPLGVVDEFGQQLDLRGHNSWSAQLGDVSIRELLQVFAINAVAPFILVQELFPLLDVTDGRKFIVNVSAMEGQFSRLSKTERHPHTNMAKAALNMFTRTTGLELKSRDIYMTAVDTGWVTDERPFHQAMHEKDRKGFKIPLDCLDGAARVLDPVFRGFNETQVPDYAVFLKNYKVHPW